MRKVIAGDGSDSTAAVKAWLASHRTIYVCDLYEFFLSGFAGSNFSKFFRWTNWQTPLFWSHWAAVGSGGGFLPASIKRGSITCKVGLDNQSVSVTFPFSKSASQLVLSAGAPYPDYYLIDAAREGFFDQMEVRIWRCYMPTPGDADTFGSMLYFVGNVSKAEISRLAATFSVDSLLQLLDKQVPPYVIDSNNLYSLQAKESDLVSSLATVVAGSTRNIVRCDIVNEQGLLYQKDTVTPTAGFAHSADQVVVDEVRQVGYVFNNDRNWAIKVDLSSRSQIFSMAIPGAPTALTTWDRGLFALDGNGDIWTDLVYTSTEFMVKLDQGTLAASISKPWPFPATSGGTTPQGINVYLGAVSPGIVVYCATYPGGFSQGDILAIRASDGSLVGTLKFGPTGVGQFAGDTSFYPVIDENGIVYFIMRDISTHDWWIQTVDLLSGADINGNFNGHTLNHFLGDTTVGDGTSLAYNPADRSLIVFTTLGAILKVDIASMTVVETVGDTAHHQFYVNGGDTERAAVIGMGGSLPDEVFFIQPTSANTALSEFRTTDLTVINTFNLTKWMGTWTGLDVNPGSWRFVRSRNSIFLVTLSDGTWTSYDLYLDRSNIAGGYIRWVSSPMTNIRRYVTGNQAVGGHQHLYLAEPCFWDPVVGDQIQIYLQYERTPVAAIYVGFPNVPRPEDAA